ncbi:multivesicular body subunit 12A isoform X2 [Cephus cinctus]|uniref:Multivesicular body subunit 12A n=1 Tax=Cephus cinctus TaxID=211228 RepID=A0AAJ7W0K4_CEPCN|nr:multivesicular body subunit 12A isoform X2 [Cephus cinctus]
MSQKSNNKMLNQLSSLLPDDRPVTAITIVEDIEKCPSNFTAVSRTYDQDSDADLWRDSGLFIKKKGRYICISKTEGVPHCVIEDIRIISERENPPEGFCLIARTVDSAQKAWRKRQLCYKVTNRDSCAKAITDIIVCSRIKKAPAGFMYAGEINGVIICYKTGTVSNGNSSLQSYANINSFQNISPNSSNGTPSRIPPERPPKPKFAPKPPNDYEVLSPNARIKPTRPAPRPPVSMLPGSLPIYGTLPGSSDLDGVPFILNNILSLHVDSTTNKLPVIKTRSQKELDQDYFYDFRAERET